MTEISLKATTLDALRNSKNTVFSMFLEPIYKALHIPQDLTYGRSALPYSPHEQTLHLPPYIHTHHEIPFSSSTSPILSKLKEHFIYYQTWQLPITITKQQRNVDILFVHGLNDYGGRFSEFSKQILEKGFRVISIDLPSFGRSSGLHSYIESWQSLVEAIYLVINHVQGQNLTENVDEEEEVVKLRRNRKIILVGGSLGGMTILCYAIRYPETFDSFVIMAPLIHVHGQSRPGKLLEYLAKFLVKTPFGRLPLAKAHRGKSSSDPLHDFRFLSDPQTYHGNLRCATGLSLLAGTEWLQSNLGEIRKPFLTLHGTNDRVCHMRGSKELISRSQTPEDQKFIILYDYCEHDMLRDLGSGKKVLGDMIDWFVKRDVGLVN
ncbi:13546_t:CDS:2 [Entrophospora sp. SA101]|nr:7176_t:CDS:2 [Entrophospora sp. SA101]CAJ0649119.1 15631_t:CDS:2 [Entrophospora sp. SA101]CAJ0762624.1 13546_t:CDS:2 [Entrophospora sp. SA101]CAJ0824077.1 10908_t:CDS:2 [Entrophospora sp. SA101]CAJ0836747.1 4614_t:CDS:2 [Entrophospora sp. SA101]